MVTPSKRSFWDRVHESAFMQGASGPPASGLESGLGPSRPFLDSETSLLVCWVWLIACPLLSLLFAWDSRNAGSADEAIPFHFIPLFLFSLILAPIVIFRGRKADVSGPQRWLHLWLGLAIVPMFVLSVLLEGLLGWQSRHEFGWQALSVLVALAVWLAAMWTVKPRILRVSC
jgi:hypothetical protein